MGQDHRLGSCDPCCDDRRPWRVLECEMWSVGHDGGSKENYVFGLSRRRKCRVPSGAYEAVNARL